MNAGGFGRAIGEEEPLASGGLWRGSAHERHKARSIVQKANEEAGVKRADGNTAGGSWAGTHKDIQSVRSAYGGQIADDTLAIGILAEEAVVQEAQGRRTVIIFGRKPHSVSAFIGRGSVGPGAAEKWAKTVQEELTKGGITGVLIKPADQGAHGAHNLMGKSVIYLSGAPVPVIVDSDPANIVAEIKAATESSSEARKASSPQR